MSSTSATNTSSVTNSGNILVFFKVIFQRRLLTSIIDHIFPPSCSSDLPCSRKPEPNAPFACQQCLHQILDGPPNSSWDIPTSDTSFHTLPGKSLFYFLPSQTKDLYFYRSSFVLRSSTRPRRACPTRTSSPSSYSG